MREIPSYLKLNVVNFNENLENLVNRFSYRKVILPLDNLDYDLMKNIKKLTN